MIKKLFAAVVASALAVSIPVPANSTNAVFGVDYYISPPFVQGSYVTGAGVSLATFNGDTVGAGNCSATVGDMSFTQASCKVDAVGVYGGAMVSTDVPTFGGTPAGTNYASVINSQLVITMAEPMRYLGFWWSAGSPSNTVVFKSQGSEVLRLTTADLMTLFGAAPGNGVNQIPYGTSDVLNIGGVDYEKHYFFGNPRGYSTATPVAASTITPAEPFVYLHVFTNGQTTFDSVELLGGGFEFDNFVVSRSAQTPAANLYKVGSALPTVYFDANTGTGTMLSQAASTATALNSNSFEKEGYMFAGWNTAPDGSGTSYSDGAIYPFSTSQTFYAQWVLPQAEYGGPLLTNFSTRSIDACKPQPITITGIRLLGAKPTVQGKPATVVENTDRKLVLTPPAGLTPGKGVDLVITSSSGTLTHQNAFDIGVCAQALSKGRWTQIQSDGKTVKIYAKDPVGDGKIQFFVDGKELAWVTAVDETDPKLSFASSFPYLVRSVDLKPGKNRFEIKVDGKRVWRTTYVPKG